MHGTPRFCAFLCICSRVLAIAPVAVAMQGEMEKAQEEFWVVHHAEKCTVCG